MPDQTRAEILELAQVGKQSDLNTVAAADKRLQAVKFDLDPQIPVEMINAQGSKAPVGVVVGKDHTKVGFTGDLAFNDFLFLASSALCRGVVTSPSGGVSRWTFFPDMDAADVFDPLTIEQGVTANAARVIGAMTDELDLSFVPDKKADMKGSIFAQSIADGISLTASPTDVPLYVVSPKLIDVYLASTEAGLSGGQIDPMSATWKVSNRHTPVFRLNSSETSYARTAERGILVAGQLVVEQDAAANAYMTSLRAGTVSFLQIVGTGIDIATSYPYRIELTQPIVFTKNARGPQQDTHCGTYDWTAIKDATFGGSVRVVVDTAMTSL